MRRWLPLAAVAALVIALGVYALGGSSDEGGGGAASAATQEAAEANAGGAVVRYSGSHHTVYHSPDPLPSADAPSPDGRPTLVWFSGTSCEFCAQMEPFAHQTAAGFRDRMRFVEKEANRDRGASSKYAVRGTPTFVLLDGAGREVTRFFYQPSAAQFSGAIEAALQQAS
ncbi:MAG: thioredoxin family protein [Dehalococcoidia bacterium]